MPEKLIRPSGNYRKLLSYQKTEVIYEMTYYFCHRCVNIRCCIKGGH
ncbi:MAG: hypothetical protein J6T64_10785 [Bacteroidaceae bacterium]|nr:hypothetical protein [Bacteroidaceae bacterium]